MAKARRSAKQKAATRKMLAANKKRAGKKHAKKRARHNPGTAAGAAKARAAKKRKHAKRGAAKRTAPRRAAKRTAKRRARRGTGIRRAKRMLGAISRRRTGKRTRAFKVKGRMLIATTRNKKTGRRRKSWVLAVRSNPSQHASKAATKKGAAKTKAAETKIKHIARKSASKARTPAELKATASAVAQGFSGLHESVQSIDKRLTHVEGSTKALASKVGEHDAKINTLDSHMRNVRGRVVGMLAASRGHKAGAILEGFRKGAGKLTKARERQMRQFIKEQEIAEMRHVGGGGD